MPIAFWATTVEGRWSLFLFVLGCCWGLEVFGDWIFEWVAECPHPRQGLRFASSKAADADTQPLAHGCIHADTHTYKGAGGWIAQSNFAGWGVDCSIGQG